MINKTFRLFISSTFDDFVDERNILNDSVFTRIDLFCQERGYNFQLIDLRWGVNNESALNQNTLAICLDEVKRCRTLSPKPNFLIMAGERYGWIPLPAKLSPEDFYEVISVASGEEGKLIKEWYILDENEIGGEYRLKFREGRYIDDNVWACTEKLLRKTLIECADKNPNISEEKRYRITASATEQEILEGMLECDETAENTIALFRTGHKKRDKDQSRVRELRKRIVDKMSQDGCDGNIIELEWNEGYNGVFERKITDILIKNISEEIARLNRLSEEVHESELLDTVSDSRDVIIERKKELDSLREYCEGESRTPLFVSGDSGSGKTTLLAQFVRNGEGGVIYSFYGMSERAYMLLDVLKEITEKLRKTFDIKMTFDINGTNMSEMFYSVLSSVPEDKSIIIIIDGLDMFHDLSEIKERVIPSLLPKNVKLIVSAAEQAVIDRFSDSKCERLHIDWFTAEESADNFKFMLRHRNRQIADEAQRKVVSRAMKAGTTPLQLKLMSEMCSSWHSGEVVDDIPNCSDEIALMHLNSMYCRYGHNKELVLYALALIAASPEGVMEEELQLLLFRFPSVREYFAAEDRHNHDLTRIPFVVWSRLFYDLKGCLTLSRVRGYIAVRFSHNVFSRVFTERFAEYYAAAEKVLIAYYSEQSDYVGNTAMPNMRKATALPVLLRKTGRRQLMRRVMSELTFIDAVVKTGDTEGAISNIRYALEGVEKTAETVMLRRIYNCLQEYREMLNCYYGEFFSCAYNHGLTDAKPLIETENTVAGDIYFPYSADLKLCWNRDGSEYAVFGGSYVYICDGETGGEMGRIYLEPINYRRVLSDEVYWLDESLIVVGTSEYTLKVYDLHNMRFRLITEITGVEIKTSVHYLSKKRIIIYQNAFGGIRAYSLEKERELWKIPFFTDKSYEFDVDEDEGVLTLKNGARRFTVYDIENGEKVRNISAAKLKRQLIEIMDFADKKGICRINEHLWLEYSSALVMKALKVYDTAENTGYYINMPDMNSINSWLFGKKYLVAVYSDVLIAADMKNGFELTWIYIPKIRNAAWVINDETISCVTDSGIKFVHINDFAQFEQGTGICMTGPENLSAKGMKPFRNLFGKYLKSEIVNYLRISFKSNNTLDYNQLFYRLLPDTVLGRVNNNLNKKSRASCMVFAGNGKTAVCYEEDDMLTVFDVEGAPILHIDRLKLSLLDNILRVSFSEDSSMLLIWRNASVTVVDIETAEQLLSLDVSERPILDIWFRKDVPGVEFVMCDGETYACEFRGGDVLFDRELPEKSSKSLKSRNCFAVYGCAPDINGRLRAVQLFNNDSFGPDQKPQYWFYDRRVYRGEGSWLYYKNGEFYAQDGGKAYIRELVDFRKCLHQEGTGDDTLLRGYLREKNDLQSSLFRVSDRYTVLVTRRLNSVIVFDEDEMKIAAAHKVSGNIIGFRRIEEERFELMLDKAPYKTAIRINSEAR